jgi:L-asparagine transporter-like permease
MGHGSAFSSLQPDCSLSVLISISLPDASASPGSLYTYIVKGLGPTAGVLSGWGLLLGYMVTGMSTLCGFAIFSQMLLTQLGIHAHILMLFAIGVIVSYGVAYKDIQLKARLRVD